MPAALDLTIDFMDSTLGGGVVISPDTALGFGSFVFDASFPDEPLLRLVCPDASEPACAGFAGPGVLVAFGDLTGLSGSHTVGLLTLTTSLPGVLGVDLAEDSVGGVAGPFQPTPGEPFAIPVLAAATVAVSSSAPALPRALWIALTAALLLAGAIRGSSPEMPTAGL